MASLTLRRNESAIRGRFDELFQQARVELAIERQLGAMARRAA